MKTEQFILLVKILDTLMLYINIFRGSIITPVINGNK